MLTITIAILLIGVLSQALFTTHAAYIDEPGIPQAATSIQVDGATRYQTIEGFGVNANSRSWDLANPGSFTPQIDTLMDDVGANIWRVVVESHKDWEVTNDNADPNSFNTAFYNTLYETEKFKKLWAMLDYLDKRGTKTIYLSVMGCLPDWMGGCYLPDDGSQDDEWVEMIASMVNYARTTKHLRIDYLSPINEGDLTHPASTEGPHMTATQYVTIMKKLSAKLDALGLGDLRLIGPDIALADNAADYLSAMAAEPALVEKYDHFASHRYERGESALVGAIAASDYPSLTPWVTEYSGLCPNTKCDIGQQVTPDENWQFTTDTFDYLLSYLDDGVTGALAWEGYDSYYEHHANYSYWGLIGYNVDTQVYSPTKRLYVARLAYRFITAGMQRIDATSDNLTLVNASAFQDSSTGKIVVIGRNLTSSPLTVSINLRGVGTPGTLQLYQSTKSVDWSESSVTPSGGSYTLNLQADSMFTLTNVSSDGRKPTVTFTTPAEGATVTGNGVGITVSASDNVGVAGIQFAVDGVSLGAEQSADSPSISWDSTSVADGGHTLGVAVRDAAGNTASAIRRVTVSNLVFTHYLPLVWY
ncbi:Ig-like domain-containing protein [Chloroflexales bacterium ZM16-3]|nr:Ig-like domain-containing protein [Chloroflexales bacterium ZM16-3]